MINNNSSERKEIPDSLDEWLNDFTIDIHSNYKYKPILNFEYEYMLKGEYRN
jgi:hypothetical protein